MPSQIKKFLRSTIFGGYRRRLRLFGILLAVYAGTGFILIPFALEKIAVPLLTSGSGVRIGLQNVSLNPFLLKIGIKGLEMGLDDVAPAIKIGEIEADFGLINTLVRLRPSVDIVHLLDPEIGMKSTQDGNNLDEIVGRLRSPATTATEPVEKKLPAFVISNLSIAHGQFAYSAPDKGINIDLGDLNLDLHDIDTGSDRDGHFNVSAMLNDHALLSVKGGLQILPSEYRIAFEMTGLDLAWVQSTFPALYPFADIKGVLDLLSTVHLQRDLSGSVTLDGLQLNLKDVHVTSKTQELASVALDHFRLSGASLNTATHEISLDAVEVSNVGIMSALDSKRQPGWQSLLPPSSTSIDQKYDSKSNAPRWKLSLRELQVKNLTLGSDVYSEDRQGLSVGGFELRALAADQTPRTVVIGSVHLMDSHLLIVNDNKGLTPFRGFIPPKAEPPINSSKPTQAEMGWSFKMGDLDVQDLSIGISDRDGTSTPPIEFNQINAHIGAFHTDEAKPTPISLQANINSGGRFALEGNINVADKTALGDVVLTNIDLSPVAPFLEGYVRIDKTAGLVSSHLALDASFKDKHSRVLVKGGLKIDGFEVNQSPANQKLLSWQELALDGIEGSLTPVRLKIKEMRLKDPVAVVDIRKDKSSNIGDIKVPSRDAKVSPEPALDADVTSDDSTKLRIHRITIERGQLNYSDQSLILPFSTQIVDLRGAVTGLTLNPKGQASLDLHGRIAPYGEAEITGQFHPQDPPSSMDIMLHMENVVLSSLSPYSATFAGRRIESGKLDLDTKYRMENHQMTSENKILLKNLRLGDRVQSPEAVSLPLDLALSLLADADGDINLSLPIEGKTDSPEFSYGGVILDALSTVLEKIVVSPFKVIAGALDLHGDDLDEFAFDLGETFLTPPEKEKVLHLVEALRRKPELMLQFSSVYDPEADLVALKKIWLRRFIAERLGEQLDNDEAPAPVNTTDPATQFALDDLAASSAVMDEAVKAYVAEFGHSPDRVGRLSRMLGKRSKTPDFYERLAKELEAHSPVGQDELKLLGKKRAETVQSALLEAGPQSLKGRISLGDVRESRSKDGHHVHMPLHVGLD